MIIATAQPHIILLSVQLLFRGPLEWQQDVWKAIPEALNLDYTHNIS